MGRWAVPGSADAVALTFDDGPDPHTTPAVLDLLDELHLRGTYFCLGQQAEAHPGLVKEIASRGHEIGLHGYRHERHLLRSAAWVRADVERAVEVLADLAGQPVRFFRPPYGQVSGGSVLAARRLHLDLVLWSAWGREWADRDAASVAGRVSRRLRPGAIVLLHDSDTTAPAGTADVMARALPRIGAELADRGLRPVGLSELVDGYR